MSEKSNLKPFQPGQSGNPGGRPKGSRNKLGEDFIKALSEHWSENGESALDACMKQSPSSYVRVVAALLPKELVIRDRSILSDAISKLTDDQLANVITELRALAGIKDDSDEEADTVH